MAAFFVSGPAARRRQNDPMPLNANLDAFAALLPLGLITDEQHDAALAHRGFAALPSLPTPAHALDWMQQQGLIDPVASHVLRIQLDRRVERNELDRGTRDEAVDVAEQAEALHRLGERGIVREAVLALHADGRIDADARDEALERVPVGGAEPDPEAAHAWLDPEPFEALVLQGLVDAPRLAIARAHPEYASLPKPPTPAHAYAWMRLRGLLPAENEDQDALIERIVAAHGDSMAEDAEDTLDESDELLEAGALGLSHAVVQALRDDGLLDAEDLEEALPWVPLVSDRRADPATALAWLVTDGWLEEERFEAIAARVEAEPAFVGADERRRIIAQARERIAAETASAKAATRKRSTGLRPPRWLGVIAVLAMVGAAGAYLWKLNALPACNSDLARRELGSLVSSTSNDERLRSEPGVEARVSALHEIGFLKPDNVRGCLATLSRDGKTETIGFTIGSDSGGSSGGSSGDTVVRGAEAAIVEARFGALDAEGRPQHNAEPVGRPALADALREGVDKLEARMRAPKTLQERLRALREMPLMAIDPDPRLALTEVEPAGACQAGDGQQQVCPVVMVYDDRRLGAIGGVQASGAASLPLRAEITLAPDDNGVWRVDGDFDRRFAMAVVEARLTKQGVSDAALGPLELPEPPPPPPTIVLPKLPPPKAAR